VRSLFIMAAVAIAVILVSGCPDKKPEPVPGPQSALTERATADGTGSRANTTNRDCPARGRHVSGISWFQGTLEEAFSPRSSKESRQLFRD
jgi:hypothetical protein